MTKQECLILLQLSYDTDVAPSQLIKLAVPGKPGIFKRIGRTAWNHKKKIIGATAAIGTALILRHKLPAYGADLHRQINDANKQLNKNEVNGIDTSHERRILGHVRRIAAWAAPKHPQSIEYNNHRNQAMA